MHLLACATDKTDILHQSVSPPYGVQATGCSDSKAEELVKRLSDSGRYHKDVW